MGCIHAGMVMNILMKFMFFLVMHKKISFVHPCIARHKETAFHSHWKNLLEPHAWLWFSSCFLELQCTTLHHKIHTLIQWYKRQSLPSSIKFQIQIFPDEEGWVKEWGGLADWATIHLVSQTYSWLIHYQMMWQNLCLENNTRTTQDKDLQLCTLHAESKAAFVQHFQPLGRFFPFTYMQISSFSLKGRNSIAAVSNPLFFPTVSLLQISPLVTQSHNRMWRLQWHIFPPTHTRTHTPKPIRLIK